MPRRNIYPDKPDDQPPVCPHCNGTDLVKCGRRDDRSRYKCRACARTSFGVLPAPFLKCSDCRAKLWEKSMADGRTRFECSKCGRVRLSEYVYSPRKQKEDSPCRHLMTIHMDRHARAGLVDYMQSTGCSQTQAVRAMFRYVLTGEVFGNPVSTAWVRSGRPTATPVPRNPTAAAMKFPDRKRELALKRHDRSKGYAGRGFQSLVLAVSRVTVMLDDAAKEGLVHAMTRLGMENHMDAARWLLAHVRVPGVKPVFAVQSVAPPFVCKTSGRRISSYPFGKYDPRWDDD